MTPKNQGGRKTLSPTGEKMRGHSIRMLESEWEDACYIGHARVRELVRKDAAWQRNPGRGAPADPGEYVASIQMEGGTVVWHVFKEQK